MKPVKILLRGSERAASFCPVSADLPNQAGEIEGLSLIDVARDLPVPCQVEPCREGARLHWIAEAVAPHQDKEYVLRRSVRKPPAARVRVKREQEGAISVTIGTTPFTRYLYGDGVPKPCLYPLIGPFGDGVTRAYPQERLEGDSTDHVHHRSLYVAWGDVNGSDNWSEEGGHGRMLHRYFDTTASGPVFGRIISLNDWVDHEGKRLIQDRIEYRFYNTPSAFRLFDLHVTFYASDGDVRFGDTKEGGILSVRVASSMEADRDGSIGRIENSLGAAGEAETWGKQASWCDYSGEVGGHIVGIAVFDHPANPRYPTYWHVRDYGLMTANPFGVSHFVGSDRDGSLVLPAGDSATFRYRVLIHAGRPREAGVGSHYLHWIFPPAAEVIG